MAGKVQIFCDNEAVVHVINSSRTRDKFMGSCLRELWLEVSTFGFELRAVHLPGVENRVADWLSRWDLGTEHQSSFARFIGDEVYKEINVIDKNFEFSNDI